MSKEKINILIELILIAIIPIICIITWFRGSYFIKTVDSFFGFNPHVQLYYSKYLWDDGASFGIAWPQANMIPLYVFLDVLFSAFGLYLGQKIAFYIFITSSILSLWMFLYFGISKEKNWAHGIARVIASLFYTFNLFSMSFFWWHHMLWIIGWIAFPVLFLLFYKLICFEKVNFLLYFIIALMFLVFAPTLNLLVLFVFLFGITLFTLFYALLSGCSLIIAIKRITKALALASILNIWYLFPLFLTLEDQILIARVLSAPGGIETSNVSSSIFEFASKYTTLLNVLGLRGNKIIYLKYMTDYYYHWAPIYVHNPFMVFITFLFPILAFSSFLFLGKLEYHEKRVLIALGVVSIISIFLQKQGAEPFGYVNRLLLNMPFGDAFRDAYDKFAILTIFSYSIMLYFALREIYLKLFRVSKIMVLFFILFIIIIYSIYTYPFWTGDVIYGGGKYIPSARVIIPVEYYQFGEFMNKLNQNKSFVRIAVLPTTWWGEAAYKWEKGIQPNSDPLLQYFLEPKYSIIQFMDANKYGDTINIKLESSLKPYSEDFERFLKILADFGVEYIVFHKDWDDNFIRYLPSTKYYETLINGYSYLGKLNGSNCFLFNGSSMLSINNAININTNKLKKFDIEVLFVPYKANSKQAIVGFGNAFWLYISEQNSIYFILETTKGYMWSSPIRVDFIKNSTVPLKVRVYYDASKRNVTVVVNGVVYHDVELYQSGGAKGIPMELNLTRRHIILGSDGTNKFVGLICYVKLRFEDNYSSVISPLNLTLGSEFIVRKDVSVIKLKIDKEIPVIEKVFENTKLAVFRLYNFNPIILTDNLSHAKVLRFYRVNPTLWKVTVNSSKPFRLIFMQSYDPRWEAYVYKYGELVEKVKPEPLYDAVNAFYINTTGENLEIVIRYTPQDWFELGLRISATTFALCVFYLVWVWRRGRGDRWALWLGERVRSLPKLLGRRVSVRRVHGAS